MSDQLINEILASGHVTEIDLEEPLIVSDYSRLTSEQMIVETLNTFCSGNVVELRCLSVDGRKNRTDSGYFEDFAKAASMAHRYVKDNSTRGVYFVLNPFAPELLARAANRFEEYAKATTADDAVTLRKWLYIDCDPKRPSGISATDEQVAAALQRAADVCEWLRSHGLCEPITAMSGNGAHLHLPINLPNDAEHEALVKGVLRTLNAEFSDDLISIDQTVSNAARICRLYGTIARKGDSTADRPHRMARLLNVPDYIQMNTGDVCDAAALQAVAARSEKPAARVAIPTIFSGGMSSGRDLRRYLQDHAIAFREAKSDKGVKLQLEECPFNPDHTAPDSFVAQFDNGLTIFSCSHDSCREYKWADFRERIGDPKRSATVESFHEVDRVRYADQPASEQPAKQPARTFAGRSAAELWDLADQPVQWLVENVFSCDQPTIFGAKQKSLKTTLLTDLAVSLASGLAWLGKFEVPQRRRVLFVTGEASEAAAIRKVKRAADSRNLRREDFTDCLRIEAITFPTLPSDADCAAVAAAVKEHGIEVVLLDPLYMGLSGLNTANLTEVGPAMRKFMAHCRPANVIIAHHVKKTASFDDAPNLEDLSQAGIAEFAGNYWLMGRMSEYTGDGMHSLAVRYGGRDEQFGLLKLDFDEREWKAEFTSLMDHRDDQAVRKETERVVAMTQKILTELKRYPDGISESKLATAAGTRVERGPFQTALAELEERGAIVCLPEFKPERSRPTKGWKACQAS